MLDKVDADTRQNRISICKTCDNLNKLEFCTVCNCFMPIKTWLKYKKCPEGKW